MFARRGFNIESLAVGPTERPDVSRITLRVECDQHSLEQIEKQMHKLVNVLRVSELEPGETVERELALIKVAITPERRPELLAVADTFKAHVADLGPDGVKELVRTGRIALPRAAGRRASRPQHVLR